MRWHRPLLLAPLFFGSLPVLSVLQIGNAQGAVAVIAVLSMLAFESKREAIGGFALALAAMAKISPGALGVILIVQKRWRALAWTAGFAALLLGATVALYGVNPVRSWVGYMMPRLGSGEAFYPMLHHPPSFALNLAPSGTPYKLGLLGLDLRDPLRIARRIDQLFTLVVIVLAAVLGARRDGGSEHQRPVRALGWMALLYLTALRSPFAPGYVIFAFVWAITFLSVEVERARGGVALAVIFAIVTLLPPLARRSWWCTSRSRRC